MAKNDNLQDFLTDVADAIRAKKGTTAKINPQDFSSEIASIQSGVEPKETKDVNFYDYDGTILYSYTWEEALQLTEMPPLPSHDGLICQGWNWTLEEMQANDGMCDVGAMYITDDGRTRLYISLEDEEYLETPFYIRGYTSNSIYNVHWGDGNVEQYASITQKMLIHTYQSVGNYVISIESIQGEFLLGYNNNGVFGASQLNRNKLRKIEFSDTCTISAGRSFTGCNMLESITMTMNQIITGGSEFDACGLHHVNLPRLNGISGGVFSNCWRMKSVSISATIPNIRNIFTRCQILRRCITPVGCISSAGQLFHTCYALENARVKITALVQNDFYSNRVLRYLPELDDNIKSIGSSSFLGCTSITSITIPSAVTQIAQNAFAYCYSMRYYDFTKLSAVPTLDNANAFTGIPADCEIRVPMSLVDEWKKATNWSTYADYIVGY